MSDALPALRASVDRLAALVTPLEDGVTDSAHPTEWTVADVVSHLGSGAVIWTRLLDDARDGATTPDGFTQTVWDEWDAKSHRARGRRRPRSRRRVHGAPRVDAERRTPAPARDDGSDGARLGQHRRHAAQRAPAPRVGCRSGARRRRDIGGRRRRVHGRPFGADRALRREAGGRSWDDHRRHHGTRARSASTSAPRSRSRRSTRPTIRRSRSRPKRSCASSTAGSILSTPRGRSPATSTRSTSSGRCSSACSGRRQHMVTGARRARHSRLRRRSGCAARA